MIRQTHTYAILEIPEEAYNFIHSHLENVGYQHTFHKDSQHGEVIDMHGIAVAKLATIPPPHTKEPEHYDPALADGQYKGTEARTLHCSCGAACTEQEYAEHLKLGHDGGVGSLVIEGEVILGEVWEHHYVCSMYSSHVFSVMLKEDHKMECGIDNLVGCCWLGCNQTANLVGVNSAEISKNPADLLQH